MVGVVVVAINWNFLEALLTFVRCFDTICSPTFGNQFKWESYSNETEFSKEEREEQAAAWLVAARRQVLLMLIRITRSSMNIADHYVKKNGFASSNLIFGESFRLTVNNQRGTELEGFQKSTRSEEVNNLYLF